MSHRPAIKTHPRDIKRNALRLMYIMWYQAAILLTRNVIRRAELEIELSWKLFLLNLTHREVAIIHMKCGIEVQRHTYKEIGTRLELSPERARQLFMEAVRL